MKKGGKDQMAGKVNPEGEVMGRRGVGGGSSGEEEDDWEGGWG